MENRSSAQGRGAPLVRFHPVPGGYSFRSFADPVIAPSMIVFNREEHALDVDWASADPSTQAVRLAPGLSDETIDAVVCEIVLWLARGRSFAQTQANLEERLARLETAIGCVRHAYRDMMSWTLVQKCMAECSYVLPTHINYRLLMLAMMGEVERHAQHAGRTFEPYPGVMNDMHHMLVAFSKRRLAVPESFSRHRTAGLLARVRFYASMKESLRWVDMPALPPCVERDLMERFREPKPEPAPGPFASILRPVTNVLCGVAETARRLAAR